MLFASKGSLRRTDPGEFLGWNVMHSSLNSSDLYDAMSFLQISVYTEFKQLLVTSVRFSPAVVEVLEKDTPAIFGPDSAAKRNEAFIQEAKGGSLLACFVGKCSEPEMK